MHIKFKFLKVKDKDRNTKAAKKKKKTKKQKKHNKTAHQYGVTWRSTISHEKLWRSEAVGLNKVLKSKDF